MSGRSSLWKHDFLFLSEHLPIETAIARLLSDSHPKKTPLVFFYGTPGVGKSHFLHAFLEQSARQIKLAPPQIFSASSICELVTDAATDKNAKTKLENIANAEFLVCEDIQSFSERFAAQQIFTSLLDRIVQSGGKIILTANGTPGDIRHLSTRFSNRCRWGGVYRLDMPSKRSREKLVAHIGEIKGFRFEDGISTLLVGNSPRTPNEMLALFEQLEHFRKVKNLTSLSLQDVREVVEGNDRESRQITLTRIAKEVARQFELSSTQLRSRQQDQNSVLPRQCAMYLARELTDKTLISIGKFFGNRSHSTVIHAWKHVTKNRSVKQELDSLLFHVQHSLLVNP